MRRHLVVFVGLVGLTLAACGQTSDPQTTATQADESQYAATALAEGAAYEQCMWDPGVPSVTAALPSSTIESGGTMYRISHAVVTGRFTAWSPGTAEHWRYPDGKDGDQGIQVDWEDPSAESRTIQMHLAVDSVIDTHDAQIGETASVWMRVPGHRDAERTAQGLIDMGDLVLFLNKPGTWEQDAWTVAMNGGLLGDLSGESLSMPLIEHLDDTSDESIFTGLEINADTIAELENAVQNPQTITQ